MTIAKRLVLLLAVPILALLALGVFTRLQLTTIETRSRFVADLQIPSLATLGNISRAFAELRVELRNHVLATSDADRAKIRAAFDRDEAVLARLLDDYERRLISDDRDRRLLNDYRTQYRDLAEPREPGHGALGRRALRRRRRTAARRGDTEHGRAAEHRLRRLDSGQRGARRRH